MLVLRWGPFLLLAPPHHHHHTPLLYSDTISCLIMDHSFFSHLPACHPSQATLMCHLVALVGVFIAPLFKTCRSVQNVLPFIHMLPFTSNLASGWFSRSVHCPPSPIPSWHPSLQFSQVSQVFSCLFCRQLSQVVLMYHPVLSPFFCLTSVEAPWFNCTPHV